MIWTIAKKEYFEKILDFRVIISFVIAIVLSAIVTLVAGGEYLEKKGEYDRQVAHQQSLLSDIRVYSEYNPVIFYPPSPLSIFSRGIDIPTPITVAIVIYRVPRYSTQSAGVNPMMNMFDSLDIGMVVRVLFSLLVVLLTFDSFSGEKERGTLRQALSNPIGRGSILHGKFFGTLMILGVVVCLTYLVALIMMRGFTGISLSSAEYLRVALMACLTLFYLAIFAALGIFSSLLLQRSSVSLAVLLFVWFFVAVFQPNLHTYLVSEFENRQWMQEFLSSSGKDDCGTEKELIDLERQHGNVFKDSTKHFYDEGGGRGHLITYGSFSMHTTITDADYEILEYSMHQVRLLRRIGDCADTDFREYKTLYSDNLDKELSRKRTLDCFSPAALFFHGASVLAQTDIDNIDGFYEQARRYRDQYFAYLDQKGVFSTDPQLYFSRLRRDQMDPVATAIRMAQYAKDTSSIPWIASQPLLDLRDAPVFTVQESNLIPDIMKTVSTAGFFLLYLSVIFIGSGWSIKLYDPR
jgi:ABC-type transport system involved in multi-copper enzyme maturation permease subunit